MPDGAGGYRISSAEFTDDELSVDRRELVEAAEKDFTFTMRQGAGVAEFSARLARDLDQEVREDPIPDNPTHALVIGKKSKRVGRQLARQSKFLS